MAKYNNQSISEIRYNGSVLDRLFYNSKEIIFSSKKRFNGDKTNAKQSEIQYTCDAGQASVNLYTGRFLFEHEDLTVGANNFHMNIRHIYSSKKTATNLGVGRGWRLNINQTCTPYRYNEADAELGFQTGDYVYIDGLGYKHRFAWYKNEIEQNEVFKWYYDTNGSLLKLKIDSMGTPEIIDSNKNRLIFNESGKLWVIYSGINSKIRKVLEYDDSNRLIKMFDRRKPDRNLAFSYNLSGMLRSITCYESLVVKKIISYSYDSKNNLILSETTVGNKTKENVRFSYEDDALACVGHCKTKSALKIKYRFENDNYQVLEMSKCLAKISSNSIDSIKNSENQTCVFQYNDDNETIARNEKNIETIYFFNKKGFTSSIFEKIGNDYKTLTKTSGWELSNSGTEQEKINEKNVIKVANRSFLIPNTSMYTLANDLSSKHNYNEKYVLSFWLHIDKENTSDITAKLHIDTRSTGERPVNLEYSSFLDKTAAGVWQYVTIPIDFECRENNKESQNYLDSYIGYDIEGFKKNLEKMQITFEGFPGDTQIKIADVRIAIGNQGRTIIDGKNFDSVERIICEIDGAYLGYHVNSSLFFTEKDIYETFKSMYNERKKNSAATFDLVTCDGTKIINVSDVEFCVKYDDASYDFAMASDGIPNYSYQSKSKVKNKTWFLTENLVRFHNGYVEQKTAIDVIKTYSGTIDESKASKNYTWTNNNGLPRAKKDAYNVITHNFYDDFGNLVRIEIYNEHDSTEKIVKNFEYETNNTIDRENIKNSIGNGVNVQQTFNSPFMQPNAMTLVGGVPQQYTKEYEYDEDFNEQLIRVKAVLQGSCLTKNELGYNSEGRLFSINDQHGHHFELDYNEYGDIVSYKTKKDGVLNEILSKKYVYNDIANDYKSKVSEEYRLDNGINKKESIINKYGNPEITTENNNITRYKYKSVKESASVAKIQTIEDPYDKQTYSYDYDDENMPIGYSTSGSSETADKSLKVRQIQANTTKYTIQSSATHNHERTSTIVYEDEETDKDKVYLQPRIYRTVDVDNEFKNKEGKDYEFHYAYDILGRFKSKTRKDDGKGIYKETITYQSKDGLSINRIGNIKNTSNYRVVLRDTGVTFYDVYDYSFSNEIQYDERGNIWKINENKQGSRQVGVNVKVAKLFDCDNSIEYKYDMMNRLDKENNSILDLERQFQYENGRLKLVTNKGVNEKAFTYNENGLLETKTDSLGVTTTYRYDNYGNVNNVIVGTKVTPLLWTRCNLLSSYGSHKYSYNHYGARCKKEVDGITKYYYLDGDRILGEDWSEWPQELGGPINPRYFYDANGISGMRVMDTNYNFFLDVFGNVRKMFKGKQLVCEYEYDSFGRCTVITYDDGGQVVEDEYHIGHINPFRWKSHYFDAETGLYYIKGRYYNPATGVYISPGYSCLNPLRIGGLNSYSLESAFGVSNPLQVPPNSANIFISIPLASEDDGSGSGQGAPWKWYHWVALGVGAAICITAGGILIAGAAGAISAGTLVGATALGAAKGALISAGIGAATGALGGALGAGLSGASGADFWNMVGQGVVMGFGIGAVTGAISGGIQGYNGWYQARLVEFTHTGTTNEVIIGRSYDNYSIVAENAKATYFHSDRWKIVHDMKFVGDKGMWKLNKMFLDSQIALNRTFTAISAPGGYFYMKELLYLGFIV